VLSDGGLEGGAEVKLTQARLKDLLYYDPELGWFMWTAGSRAGRAAGSFNKRLGYVVIGVDGVDGLSGGVMSAVFTAYGMIAYANGQVNLAAFCFVVVGGIMAFLWFNIPPALFYLTETGMLSLSLSLSVVAFLTNAVAYLPIIALPLLATTASVILQLTWKKIFKKKLFLVAPMHHHFQALGWPSYKVTMRYWIVSYICAMLGVIIALVG
jgi:phospho-N-acetylmuramoyl-pentapeptide-transferase